MAEKALIVNVTYDPEAKVWYTEESPDLFGVIACAPSLEELRLKLPGVIQDMIEFNKPEWIGHNIAVEIVAIANDAERGRACGQMQKISTRKFHRVSAPSYFHLVFSN